MKDDFTINYCYIAGLKERNGWPLTETKELKNAIIVDPEYLLEHKEEVIKEAENFKYKL